jgi:hypothetical protein
MALIHLTKDLGWGGKYRPMEGWGQGDKYRLMEDWRWVV